MTKRLSFALAIATVAVAGSAFADNSPELNKTHFFPDQASAQAMLHAAGGGGGGSNLSYHNGPVIHSARVVAIFWGPSWGTGGADNATANHIIAFFNQFGTSSHYASITQYGDTAGKIQTTSLGNTAWFDSSTPPTNVTDAAIQGEVNKYLSSGGGTYDASTVYEVFLPRSSYSSNGSSTSCGGPNLKYCAYHGNYAGAHGDTKYASMPYPSCGGCQSAGFSDAQNFDHFSCHETREAVTDPDGTGWWDRTGYEADDKCAWSPTPFLSGGYGYQYEWSNAKGGCVQ